MGEPQVGHGSYDAPYDPEQIMKDNRPPGKSPPQEGQAMTFITEEQKVRNALNAALDALDSANAREAVLVRQRDADMGEIRGLEDRIAKLEAPWRTTIPDWNTVKSSAPKHYCPNLPPLYPPGTIIQCPTCGKCYKATEWRATGWRRKWIKPVALNRWDFY